MIDRPQYKEIREWYNAFKSQYITEYKGSLITAKELDKAFRYKDYSDYARNMLRVKFSSNPELPAVLKSLNKQMKVDWQREVEKDSELQAIFDKYDSLIEETSKPIRVVEREDLQSREPSYSGFIGKFRFLFDKLFN